MPDVYLVGSGLSGLRLTHGLPCAAENGAEVSQALKAMLPGLQLRRVPFAAQLALLAAGRALLAAGLCPPLNDEPAQETGIYTGAEHGAAESTLEFVDSIITAGPRLASPTPFSYSVGNSFAGFISQYCNIQGPANTCALAGLSVYGAFLAAFSALKAGVIKNALVGVVEDYPQILQKACLSQAIPASPGGCSAFFFLSLAPQAGAYKLQMPGLGLSGPAIDAASSVNGASSQDNQGMAFSPSMALALKLYAQKEDAPNSCARQPEPCPAPISLQTEAFGRTGILELRK